MPWLRSDGDAVVLSLHVQPGAKATEVSGVHGTALKVRLAAPPVDGKANAALLRFLVAQVCAGRTAIGAHAARPADLTITLVSGESARQKRVRISGVDAATVRAALRPEDPPA